MIFDNTYIKDYINADCFLCLAHTVYHCYLFFSPSHIQYCAAIYGAAYAGAIVATINNNYTSSK